MNEWLTYVYNLVESCDYGDSSERIIKDVLIVGCNSDKAKDKIVRQGEKIKLQDVIEILQLEDSTRQTLTEMTSTTQKIHYASYEKKKGTAKKEKFQSNSNVSSSYSSGKKQDSGRSQNTVPIASTQVGIKGIVQHSTTVRVTPVPVAVSS